MNDEILTVPYVVYEGEMARSERMIKRLFVALVVSVICLFASNGAWLWYESLYDTISYEQDGEGINNVNYGEQGDLSNVPKGED